MGFEDIKEKNRKDPLFTLCQWTSIALFPIITIAIYSFISRKGGLEVFSDSNWFALIARVLPCLFYYAHGYSFLSRLLVKIPENFFTRLCTFICGVLYIILIILSVNYEKEWFLIFGWMMIVLSARNGIGWMLLYFNDRKNPLKSYFGKWFWAALGYALLIFLFSPLLYSIKSNPNTEIVIPIINKNISQLYIDWVPAIVIIVGMFVSIFRLTKEEENIDKSLKEHYGN